MKAALVFSTDSCSVRQLAAEINAALKAMDKSFSRLELWLFCTVRPSDGFPKMDLPVSAVKLIPMKSKGHLPEAYLHLLMQLLEDCPMDLLVFPSDGLGAELATRLGYRVNGTSCLQVETCELASNGLEVTKPVYGNNLTARFNLTTPPYCLSVAKRPCRPVKLSYYEKLEINTITLNYPHSDWLLRTAVLQVPPDSGLVNADWVLVVGQGAKNKATVELLKKISDDMGFEMAASRPVVMNAWMNMNRLVGVSGMIISPKICIAAGVSGTPVFSVGIKDSEFIVAINTDRNASIFQMANVGIIGDMKGVLSELSEVIVANRKPKR